MVNGADGNPHLSNFHYDAPPTSCEYVGEGGTLAKLSFEIRRDATPHQSPRTAAESITPAHPSHGQMVNGVDGNPNFHSDAPPHQL